MNGNTTFAACGIPACVLGNRCRCIGIGRAGFALTYRGGVRCFAFRQIVRKAARISFTHRAEFAEFLMATPEAERRGRVFKLSAPSGRRVWTYRPDTVSNVVCAIGKRANIKVEDTKRHGKPYVKFASAHDLRRSFGERWSTRRHAASVAGTHAARKHRNDAEILRRAECRTDGGLLSGGLRKHRIEQK